ncbi:RNA polymerase, sigma-24 subunit, ECF subfamily [Emticicia oligotrophica DSM 17448]|uniref:RNA polymerase, sigma-24 subunit, ECF subfamily n=1 Tax=Emticicia oligotrophica (strain DSM 17448 / CIP 109782 / MTCC 6937 / GPTSA100-15) TaxID=929562 RepID=A0ABN4ABF9_EMTOG|nr:sigma-70 family RNA polymerase sigma factor [Emticicia oligotrophica]AFK01494.1 RNA polymerase, sigma-24 subunit, ECF subfamily [Emticicia oligotrophica DSM 17448]
MNKNEHYLDGLLWEALLKDDEKALGYLFNTYYNKLYRAGLKWCLDSDITEEAIQLIFSDLWKYRHTLTQIQSFEAYLKSSLKKRIFKELQKADSIEKVNWEDAETFILSTQSYEEILIKQEADESLKVKLRLALEELTPRQKEIIMLKYFEEMSFKEISVRTNLQTDSVYKTLHEAIKKLRTILK